MIAHEPAPAPPPGHKDLIQPWSIQDLADVDHRLILLERRGSAHGQSTAGGLGPARPVDARRRANFREKGRRGSATRAPDAFVFGPRSDDKRGVTPENVRAIIASVCAHISTSIYGPAAVNYLTACAHDSGLLDETSEIVMSAAAVLTEGLDDGALWGFVHAANNLELLAYQRLVADLKVALGKEIVAWAYAGGGRPFVFAPFAISMAFLSMTSWGDLTRTPGSNFSDQVRITLVAAQRSKSPVGRAKLERKIASAGARLVRRVGQSERKGKR